MSADTGFFFPFFQREMEKKKTKTNRKETELPFWQLHSQVLSPTLIENVYVTSIKRRENNTFIKETSEHAGSLVTILFVRPCITLSIACSRRSDSGERCEVKRGAKK